MEYEEYYDEDGDLILKEIESQVPDPQQAVPETGEKIPEETEMIDDAAKEGINDNFMEDVFKILLKDRLSENNEEEEEEVQETTEEEEVLNNESEEELSSGNSGITTIDYTDILGDISGKLDINNENVQYIIAANENNNMNSTLNTQSCTNVLLMIIIVIMLVDIVVHFIRGLF